MICFLLILNKKFLTYLSLMTMILRIIFFIIEVRWDCFMKILSNFKFNKEDRLAFVIIMFFGLAYFSPFIWENFDQARETLAINQEATVSYASLEPSPTSVYVIEDFFSSIDHEEYEKASSYFLKPDTAEEFMNSFSDLYHIKALNISQAEILKTKTHTIIVNTIDKESGFGKSTGTTKEITITLIKDSGGNWKILKISY